MRDIKIRFLQDSKAEEIKVSSFIHEWNSDNSHIKVKTSGSTGKPKEILIKKAKMKVSAEKTIDFLGLKSGFKSLLCLSAENVGGKMMIARTLLFGDELIVSPVNSNPLLSLEDKVEFCAMVPMQVETTLEQNPEKFELIENLIIGGAPISPVLDDKISSIPCNCFHTFGMTETVSHIALRNISKKEKEYKAIGDTTFSIIEECLVINCPSLGIVDLKTNDIVKLTSSQSFEWLGRKDFVINSGGVKLHPELIENELAKYISQNFFVFGKKNAKLGQQLELLIEGEPTDSVKVMIERITLPQYYAPKKVHFSPKFVETTSGKVNRLLTLKKEALLDE